MRLLTLRIIYIVNRRLYIWMPSIRLLVIIGVVAVAVAVVGFIGLAQIEETKLRGVTPQETRKAPDFILRDVITDREFRLSEQRGEVLLIYFGYTNCHDVCPVTMLMFREIQNKLYEAGLGEKVKFVFVTTDPVRDTPEVLKNYVSNYGLINVAALTGELEELEKVERLYGVPVEYTTPEGEKIPKEDILAGKVKEYFVGHGSFVYVIGPDGYLRELLLPGMKIKDIIHDLKIIIG